MNYIISRTTIRDSRLVQSLWPVVIICVAFFHNLYVSWLKWGDPVVDSGREWLMPLRMLQGEDLYSEHRNLYGPLAPYLNMLLFKVFGVHLSVLQVAGIVSAALMTITIYFLARRFVGRVPSVVMSVSFLYAFGFAHLTPNPSFNFVLPYAYAATYGIIAATLGLFFLICHVQERKDYYLALSIVGLVLAALSKLEVVIPIAAAHIVSLIEKSIMHRITRRQILLYVTGAVVLVVTYGLLVVRAGTHLWTDNLAAVSNRGNVAFALETMGLDNPISSLQEIAISAIIMAIVMGAGIVASLLLRQSRAVPIRWAAVVLPASFGLSVYATLGTDLPLRLLPATVIVVLAVLTWRLWRLPELRSDIFPTLLLWVFAAGCLARLGLRVGPFFYGFFLVPVPFVALGILLYRDLPAFLARIPSSRLPVTATAIAIIIGFTIAAFATSTALYSQHTMDVNTPRGHIILRGERWQKDVISYLQKISSDMRVVVIPQGAGLLFLSAARMAGGLYNYVPMEFSGRYTDERLVQQLQSRPPDLVVFLDQDPGSFRYTGFGIDFGWQTAKWLQVNYVPVAGNREVTILQYTGAR